MVEQVVRIHKICKIVISVFVYVTFLYSCAFAASEKVVLTTEDGYRISGIFTKSEGKSGVVLLHMYRNNKKAGFHSLNN